MFSNDLNIAEVAKFMLAEVEQVGYEFEIMFRYVTSLTSCSGMLTV